VHHGIVEGEPGIFPDPVARVMRAVGRLFRRGERRPAAPASGEASGSEDVPEEGDGTPTA
jgi:hypothetical protein